MNYDELEAGRELDALIEVVIFGGTCGRCEKQPAGLIVRGTVYCSAECEERISEYTADYYQQHRSRYSEEIAAAWLVVEKLGAFTLENGGDAGEEWSASFFYDAAGNTFWVHGDASTAPLAICRAALKAVAATPPASTHP